MEVPGYSDSQVWIQILLCCRLQKLLFGSAQAAWTKPPYSVCSLVALFGDPSQEPEGLKDSHPITKMGSKVCQRSLLGVHYTKGGDYVHVQNTYNYKLYVYIYMHLCVNRQIERDGEREREMEREREGERERER